MIAPLLGIPALLNTLLTRLTSDRAAALDNIANLENLDIPISSLPTSFIRSVRRGKYTSTSAGNVPLDPAVADTTKTIVISESKGSSGYVAARGTLAQTITPSSSTDEYQTGTTGPFLKGVASSGSTPVPSYTGTGSLTSGTDSNLYVKQYSAYLENASTLSCDGPCNWQVIEFY